MWTTGIDPAIPLGIGFSQPGGAERALTVEMTSRPTRRVGSFGPFHASRVSSPDVEPLPLLVLGLGLLIAGALYLRSFGPGQRVGRLLASTPRVSVAQAVALTTDAVPRYVRVDGRLDSDEDFPDERDQPLIFRRRRLEAWRGRRWEVLSEARDLVPFQVNEGLDSIGIDGDALNVGLVVLPREAVGAAAEAPGLLPEGLDPRTRVRLRVEQISAVEHATIVGTPALNGSGRPVLTAGTGRPLILSTLEPAEAMQLLSGGRNRAMVVAILLVGGLALLGLGLAWSVVRAVAG
jgi:hypothetical protein